ncbi:MAG: NAD(P)/FAD-dependent oxidoreductase [Pseudomonadota bacterium]
MANKTYDAIVIGSGIGGLSATALLTCAGYKTLLVEKLPRLGGRFSSMDYKGYMLPTGALWLPAEGVVPEIFREIGAEYKLRCPDPQSHYRVGGKDYEIPVRGRLKYLISAAAEDETEAKRVLDAIQKAISWHEPSTMISFRDWLMQYTQNPRILGIFRALITAWHTVNSHEISAGKFFRFLKTSNPTQFGYPPDGAESLMNSLAQAIRAKGGEVWTQCSVKRITVTEGKVRGVVVEKNGEQAEIEAGVVISNAGPKKTVQLTGEENFDRGYLMQMANFLRPIPVTGVALSSDRPLIDCPGTLLITEARRLNIIFNSNQTCPEHSPPGRYYIHGFSAPENCLGPVDFKKEIDLLIMDLKDNIPGFDAHAEILHVSCFSGEWPVIRSWPDYRMPQTTLVENLYNVGDGVEPAEYPGVSGAVQSARMVVEDIKKRIPVERLTILAELRK